MKKLVQKTLKGYDWLIETVLITLFISMIILMFSEVVARHFFNNPIIWSEELGRTLFIWCVYLGAALAYMRKLHITIDYFQKYIPKRLELLTSALIDVVLLTTMVFVLITGTRFASGNFNIPSYSIPYFSLGWAYVAIPIGATTMLISIARTWFDRANSKGRKIIKN